MLCSVVAVSVFILVLAKLIHKYQRFISKKGRDESCKFIQTKGEVMAIFHRVSQIVRGCSLPFYPNFPATFLPSLFPCWQRYLRGTGFPKCLIPKTPFYCIPTPFPWVNQWNFYGMYGSSICLFHLSVPNFIYQQTQSLFIKKNLSFHSSIGEILPIVSFISQ